MISFLPQKMLHLFEHILLMSNYAVNKEKNENKIVTDKIAQSLIKSKRKEFWNYIRAINCGKDSVTQIAE